MYKLGDRVRSVDRLHGHDSRIIHGVIGAIDGSEFDPCVDPIYRIDWNEGGCDWLVSDEFEPDNSDGLKPDYDEVYLAEINWDIHTTIGTNRGHAVAGLYRSVNTTKVIDEMVAKVKGITGANIDRSRVHNHTAHDGSLEVTYSVGGCNIIGFVSKMPIKEE